MKLREIVKELELKVRCDGNYLNKPVNGGYASDLLSDVIANSRKDDIWITLQTHQNIAGVASLKELAGIIIVNAREPEAETLQKAEKESIPVFSTSLPAFEIVGKLYQLGIRGTKNVKEV
jgi:hypothetical protein